MAVLHEWAAVSQPSQHQSEPGYWTPLRYFQLSVFWFSLSTHWGALLTIIIPDMAKELAGPEMGRGTILAIVSSCGAVLSALVQITAGHHSDRSGGRWGRRRVYIYCGTMLAPLGLYLLGQAHTVWGLLAAVALIQLTLNIANGPYQALIPDRVPRELHGTASTWMGLFQHGGQVAGPLLAGYFLSHTASMEDLAALLAGLLLIGMAITVFGVHEPPAEPIADGKPWYSAFQVPLAPYPEFVQLLKSRLIINLGYYAVVDFMLYYVHYTLGVENYKKATANLMAAMVFGGLLGGLPAGVQADRYDKVKLIYWINGVTALAAVAFAVISDLRGAYFAGILLGTGFGAFQVVDWALACNRMPEGGRGRYMGVWNLTAVLPQVLTPVLLGPLTDWVASNYSPGLSYRLVMVAVVVFLVVGTLFLKPSPDDPARQRTGAA